MGIIAWGAEHWCANLVFFICIWNVSVILGLLFLQFFYDIDEKASYTSYHQSINMQLTNLQASQTALGKPKLTHPGSTNGNHIRWASLHRSLTFRQVTHIPYNCHFFLHWHNFCENKIYTQKRRFFALNL